MHLMMIIDILMWYGSNNGQLFLYFRIGISLYPFDKDYLQYRNKYY
uniref:Uncharacterized protein n=1 Tax=Heterorhabditis bacteriophora TaxID=37862 RepID=A0A1I7WT22_HETBA